MNMQTRKLKRVVIKEELIALTGKLYDAIVLNQMIYWSERMYDSENFVKEELERARKFQNPRTFADGSEESLEDIAESLRSGWIYKSAEQMIEETMLDISDRTMQRTFNNLVENKWLDRRRNPKYKWDKTWQYRVNLHKIQQDLMELGYSLEGYSLPEYNQQDNDLGDSDASNGQFDGSSRHSDASNGQFDGSSRHSDASNGQHDASNGHYVGSERHSVAAIPEITTEITLKNDDDDAREESFFPNQQNKKEEVLSALRKYAPSSCYIDHNLPMGETYILDTYLMLLNEFPNQLSEKLVELACDQYFSRACEVDSTGFIRLRFEIKNPVGFFQKCYKDAINRIEAQRREPNTPYDRF